MVRARILPTAHSEAPTETCAASGVLHPGTFHNHRKGSPAPTLRNLFFLHPGLEHTWVRGGVKTGWLGVARRNGVWASFESKEKGTTNTKETRQTLERGKEVRKPKEMSNTFCSQVQELIQVLNQVTESQGCVVTEATGTDGKRNAPLPRAMINFPPPLPHPNTTEMPCKCPSPDGPNVQCQGMTR